MKGTYYFSFRSPYSWLASKLLSDRINRGDELELIPFWEPDEEDNRILKKKNGTFPYGAMSDIKHRYILMDIRRLSSKFGYQMKWPVDSNPWWSLSHLAYIMADQMGYGLRFFWAVYEARWEKGLDISDPNVIEQICIDLGLDAHPIVNAHQDPEIREKGGEHLYQIYRQDIFGVPMFTIRRDKFWGIDRLPFFLKKLENIDSEQIFDVTEPFKDFLYDFDHAGGCG